MVTCGMNALLVCCILFVQNHCPFVYFYKGEAWYRRGSCSVTMFESCLRYIHEELLQFHCPCCAMSTLNLVVGLKRRSDVSCIKVAAWWLASHHRNVKFNTGRLAEMSPNHRSALSQAFFVARAWFFLTCRASFNIAIVADLKKDMVFRERLKISIFDGLLGLPQTVERKH